MKKLFSPISVIFRTFESFFTFEILKIAEIISEMLETLPRE